MLASQHATTIWSLEQQLRKNLLKISLLNKLFVSLQDILLVSVYLELDSVKQSFHIMVQCSFRVQEQI